MSACFAERCERRVREPNLMCRDHWYRVPVGIRSEIWREFRRAPGSPEHLAACVKGRDAVARAEAEGKRSVKP